MKINGRAGAVISRPAERLQCSGRMASAPTYTHEPLWGTAAWRVFDAAVPLLTWTHRDPVAAQAGEGGDRLDDLEAHLRVISAGTDHQGPLKLGGQGLEGDHLLAARAPAQGDGGGAGVPRPLPAGCPGPAPAGCRSLRSAPPGPLRPPGSGTGPPPAGPQRHPGRTPPGAVPRSGCGSPPLRRPEAAAGAERPPPAPAGHTGTGSTAF